MIIATDTAYALTRLFLCSFASGVTLYILYWLSVLIFALPMCLKAVKLGFAAFSKEVEDFECNTMWLFICDLMICVVAACTACALFFLHNNGQFRILGVLLLCVGFRVSKSLFSKPLKFLVEIILYILLKILFFLGFPIMMLTRQVGMLTYHFIKKAFVAHKVSLMRKYTKEKFDKLDELAEFGLIDKLYKEIINERIV